MCAHSCCYSQELFLLLLLTNPAPGCSYSYTLFSNRTMKGITATPSIIVITTLPSSVCLPLLLPLPLLQPAPAIILLLLPRNKPQCLFLLPQLTPLVFSNLTKLNSFQYHHLPANLAECNLALLQSSNIANFASLKSLLWLERKCENRLL